MATRSPPVAMIEPNWLNGPTWLSMVGRVSCVAARLNRPEARHRYTLRIRVKLTTISSAR
jgi:hypothetical protein